MNDDGHLYTNITKKKHLPLIIIRKYWKFERKFHTNFDDDDVKR